MFNVSAILYQNDQHPARFHWKTTVGGGDGTLLMTVVRYYDYAAGGGAGFQTATTALREDSDSSDLALGTICRVTERVSPSDDEIIVASYTVGDPPPPPEYWVNFPIPAGDGTNTVSYYALQDGKVIGMTSQSPDGSPFMWRLGPLDNHDPVGLNVITGGFLPHVGDNPNNTQGYGVGNPLTPSAGSSSGGGATGPTFPTPTPLVPSNPTPPTPPNPNPPPNPDPPTPPHKDPPNLPFGSGGTTKADTEKQTNDLVDALNNVNDGTAAAGKATKDAVDKLNTDQTANSNGVITAVNNVTAAVDKVRAVIESENAITGIPGSGVTVPDPAHVDSKVDFTRDPITTVTTALPEAPTFSAMTNVSTWRINFTIPTMGHGDITVDKTVDFSQAPYIGPITIFRGFTLVLVTVGFYFAAFWAVRGAVTGK